MKFKRPVDVTKPVVAFFEDGDWVRVEAQGLPTRYLPGAEAQRILHAIGVLSKSVKFQSDLILVP